MMKLELKDIPMKRVVIILGAVMLGVSSLRAQLMPQFSQFMFNDYALNPAIGGIHDYWQVRTNFRLQNTGIESAPVTYMLGGYGPHKTLPMGYGGIIFNDITGPISNLGMFGSYSYNIRIAGDLRLSMGLFAGIVQQRVDLNSITFNDVDPVFADQQRTKFYPDGSLGGYLYTSQYYVGLTWHHIFFNDMTLLEEIDADFEISHERIRPHFIVQGGYRYNLNRNFDIIPNIVMKGVPNFDFMTDFAVHTIYQKLVWGGLGMRYSFKNVSDIFIYAGYNYNDLVNIGYSYDLGVSKLRSAHSGSHEIMISVKFGDLKKSKSKRKIR